MTSPDPCHRCGAAISQGIPKPGLTRFVGKVTKTTWRIRFNYLRMDSWENAVTAQDVIASSSYSEIDICDTCWGDVLSFVNTKIVRSR